MITLIFEESNTLNQKIYNELIDNLQLHQLTCCCGHSSCLTIHGYYKRKIKTSNGKDPLLVCRVICSECNLTHALLPSCIVPYSQIPLSIQVNIITASENELSLAPIMEETPSVDESDCFRVLKRYKQVWKQKLLSENISLSNIKELVLSCFKHYSRQFMQIRCTTNILFLETT